MTKSVRDVMTEGPRSIGVSASVVEAARLMREVHVSSLEAAELETTSVGDVYSRDLISVEPDRDLGEALRRMARHQIRRLRVVEDGRLVGIVAQADIAL